MIEHAPGRLYLLSAYDLVTEQNEPVATTGVELDDSKPSEISADGLARMQANARRIQACWNACVGVTTEALESPYTALQEIVRLRQERDELIVALRNMPLPQCDAETLDHIPGIATVQALREKHEGVIV